MMYEITMAGPANWAAAVPVSTKMPAPMIPPMPIEIRLMGPSARLSECSPHSLASARMLSIGLVAKSLNAIHCLHDYVDHSVWLCRRIFMFPDSLELRAVTLFARRSSSVGFLSRRSPRPQEVDGNA